MRFSSVHHAVLTELTHETGCRSKHLHRNGRLHFGAECRTEPQTRRAAQCRTQLAIERASQAGARCATRRAVHCRVERGAEVLTDGGPEFLGLGATDRRAQPRTRRGTDRRVKSLIDGHIDGRVGSSLELRGQSGSDSPSAGARARHSPGL
jgi:hypothetical protein